jgi:hypothetical protein
MAEKQLTDKQALFITEYLKSFNAAEAARLAGYKGRSDVEGARLLVILSDYLEDARPSNSIMSPEEVLAELSIIGRGDMGSFIDDNSLSINLNSDKARSKMRLVKKIKYTTFANDDSQTDTVEFELYDKVKALELLGKYYALFKDRVQVDDWHTQAIEDIKRGLIDYHSLAEAFDTITATELFIAAGQTLPSE